MSCIGMVSSLLEGNGFVIVTLLGICILCLNVILIYWLSLGAISVMVILFPAAKKSRYDSMLHTSSICVISSWLWSSSSFSSSGALSGETSLNWIYCEYTDISWPPLYWSSRIIPSHRSSDVWAALCIERSFFNGRTSKSKSIEYIPLVSFNTERQWLSGFIPCFLHLSSMYGISKVFPLKWYKYLYLPSISRNDIIMPGSLL